jgi:hypothetical protein
MVASAHSLTETRPALWLNSCSWCCGDLTPSVPQAGLQRVCLYCGWPEPVARQGQQRRHLWIRGRALSTREAYSAADDVKKGLSYESVHVAEAVMSDYAVTASVRYCRGAARETRCQNWIQP